MNNRRPGMIGMNTFTNEILSSNSFPTVTTTTSSTTTTTATMTNSVPLHTFPSGSVLSLPDLSENGRDYLEDEISTILINSDPEECNENFLIYLKIILDNIYINKQPLYKDISKYSLKLIKSNLFTKNFKFCVGKIIAFLETFTVLTKFRLEEEEEEEQINEDDERAKYESECLKEFLCIVLLLLIKIKNTEHEKNSKNIDFNDGDVPKVKDDELSLIPVNELFETFREFKLMSILSSFISTQIIAINNQESKFVILKFSCDIIFEYFYQVEMLNNEELNELTKHDLIPTLIKYLLNNDDFHNYDLDGDEFEDESRLIAYEELKLLLLINEQFLMKSYYDKNLNNLVFDELLKNVENLNQITGLINLLIYHLNREESQIIKILILKFLYLVFVSSCTCKLIYLNDLKILIDIIIRELNNTDDDKKILTMTYLRVLYPILIFSQINENDNYKGYKNNQILQVLREIIINYETKLQDLSRNDSNDEDNSISKLAIKCMHVKWLKNPSQPNQQQHPQHHHHQQQQQQGTFKTESPESDEQISIQSTNSKESLTGSFTRVASVRASSRSDYHKHTTTHNIVRKNSGKSKNSSNSFNNQRSLMIEENNGNVFLSKISKISLSDQSTTTPSNPQQQHHHQQHQQQPSLTTTTTLETTTSIHSDQISITSSVGTSDSNILDLPDEYLNSKPLPKIPLPTKAKRTLIYSTSNNSSTSSINSSTSLKQKALKKKAPPPPPPPPRRRK